MDLLGQGFTDKHMQLVFERRIKGMHRRNIVLTLIVSCVWAYAVMHFIPYLKELSQQGLLSTPVMTFTAMITILGSIIGIVWLLVTINTSRDRLTYQMGSFIKESNRGLGILTNELLSRSRWKAITNLRSHQQHTAMIALFHVLPTIRLDTVVTPKHALDIIQAVNPSYDCDTNKLFVLDDGEDEPITVRHLLEFILNHVSRTMDTPKDYFPEVLTELENYKDQAQEFATRSFEKFQ